jgi:hypothetical protein
MPDRTERHRRIQALEEARDGRRVVCYITSTRDRFSSMMGMDVIPVLHRHLQGLRLPRREKARIDLLIHSYGGDSTVPGRLMALLREFAADVDVLVPHCAFSAATLTAMGANRVVMHRKMGMLGPIDPTINDPFNPMLPERDYPQSIQVENVKAFKNFAANDYGLSDRAGQELAFKALTDQVHPLALGNVSRHIKEAEMQARNQLEMRGTSKTKCDEIIANFALRFFYHNRPITIDHAVDHLGLDFVTGAETDVEKAMWDVYLAYEEELRLEEPFSPLFEAISAGLLPPKPTPATTSAANEYTGLTLPMKKERAACVESLARCDWYESPYELSLYRDWSGKLTSRLTEWPNAWRQERQTGTARSDAGTPGPTRRRREEVPAVAPRPAPRRRARSEA